MTSRALIEQAFERLTRIPGFVERVDQQQLALVLGDLMAGAQSGAIEAPTGLGKSLAALIPAIARAIADDQRSVIATYTNVLAEQYWRKDLPFALSLFDPEDTERIKTAFLVGRQRYLCLVELDEAMPELVDVLRSHGELGIESEFMQLARKPMRELRPLWQKVAAPAACAAKSCPLYDDCYYYKARKEAGEAHLVITNHSVVIMDAILAQASQDGEAGLGKIGYLVIDEAHDFYAAAVGSLEFELSSNRLSMVQAIGMRLFRELLQVARENGQEQLWRTLCDSFKDNLEESKHALLAYRLETPNFGILAASPVDMEEHPGVKRFKVPDGVPPAEAVAKLVSKACRGFVDAATALIATWQNIPRRLNEPVQNYKGLIGEYGHQCDLLLLPIGVSVSYSSLNFQETILRQDLVGVDEPLKELIWNRLPVACMSATLSLDGRFDFFKDAVGMTPDYEEILPSPFDFSTQAALYVPPVGAIPDPSLARKSGTESEYYAAIARELANIIETMGGRTLALFHSRREMEAVFSLMPIMDDLPIYMQPRQGARAIGDKFKRLEESSLFALRSFWTGFDAPGDTCSCVAVVRVPFEVPVEPPAIVRVAYMQSKGQDSFTHFTLPMAKMMVRQGVGRLLRREEDRGVIVLLDPRLRTKRYGEDILANLPSGMRTFDDFGEAAAFVGLAAI